MNLPSTSTSPNLECLVSYRKSIINFISLFVLFYKKFEEEATKVKRTPVHLEIANHIIKYLNRNISEEVNFNTYKSFMWLINLYSMIYPLTHI